MWPFEVDDKERKDEPLTPEQREQVRQSILQRYSTAADTSDVDAAADDASSTRMAADIGQAIEGLGRARSVARGGRGVDPKFYAGLKENADKDLTATRQARKDRMENVLTEDQLGWQEKERTQKQGDWGFQDKERGQKEKGWEIDDAYNSADSQQSVAIRQQYAQMFPDLAKEPGFEGLSANDIKNGLSEPLKLKESIAARKEEARQRGADRQAMMGVRTQEKADAKADKEELYQAGIKIPGLEVAPGFRPTNEAAGKVRTAKTSRDSLTASLSALSAVYDETGTNAVGPDSNTQSALVESMKMELKNLQALGALSGSDYASLERQIPDPTTTSENLKGMVGLDSFKDKAAAFQQQLDSKLNATATNAGYRASSAPSAPPPGKGGVHGKDLP